MMECMKFKSHPKGTLLGFADFRLPKIGIEIYGCTMHQKNGRRWVNLPSRPYENEFGEKKHALYVRFIEQAHYSAFIEKALKAIEEKCKSENITIQEGTLEPDQESLCEMPF